MDHLQEGFEQLEFDELYDRRDKEFSDMRKETHCSLSP
jgi:hypothetical protein